MIKTKKIIEYIKNTSNVKLLKLNVNVNYYNEEYYMNITCSNNAFELYIDYSNLLILFYDKSGVMNHKISKKKSYTLTQEEYFNESILYDIPDFILESKMKEVQKLLAECIEDTILDLKKYQLRLKQEI